LSARDFLGQLIGFLDQAGVPYMIAGSFASTYHGPPRATQDADLVIDPRPESLEMLLRLVTGAGLYVPDRVAREALRQRGQWAAELEVTDLLREATDAASRGSE
jgi:hypothetical protein